MRQRSRERTLKCPWMSCACAVVACYIAVDAARRSKLISVVDYVDHDPWTLFRLLLHRWCPIPMGVVVGFVAPSCVGRRGGKSRYNETRKGGLRFRQSTCLLLAADVRECFRSVACNRALDPYALATMSR